MGKTIKHTNMLQPNPGLNKKGYRYFEFICRGCTMQYRKTIWAGFVSSIDGPINKAIDNSYLTLEEEPSNKYDPNAIMVVCRGEFFGTVGYVGKEFTTEIKEILRKCVSYRVDMVDEEEAGEREISLVLTWCEESVQEEPDEEELTDEELAKQFEEDDSNLEFIWGLRSYDDLTGQCDIHSLNDIELLFDKEKKEYFVSVETIYEFEHPDGKAAYLLNLLKAFTDWMQEQGHDTEMTPELSFALEHTNQGRFKTMEEAYLDFRLRVTGFCALCKKDEQDPFYSRENITELERRIEEIESGNASLTEHELMEE